jgi:anti-sigma regulatory factor (Ser/Thr protein kinase)
MEGGLSLSGDFSIAVGDASHVAAARSAAQRMSRGLGFDDTRTGRLAIAITEAVTNILKHTGSGTLIVRSLEQDGRLGIEALAIDSGPGMASVTESSRDGVSTVGTQGTGLGAMRRQSDEVEIHSEPGRGTIVRMVFWDRDPAPRAAARYHELGAVNVPKSGETVSGDAWGAAFHAQGATFMVADGLGHGPDAHRASIAALEVLRAHPEASVLNLLERAHGKLRPTRGAAVAVMRHDVGKEEVAFAGAGNISAVIVAPDGRQAMVSHGGIVGHNLGRPQEYRYSWPRGALLVAHSDGLDTRWDLAAHPGLRVSHPSVIAGLLYRQHSRGRDDCTVLVARALQ